MKLARLALTPVLLVVAGCLEIEIKVRDPLAAPAPPPAPRVERVTADRVTPENARVMAQRLWDEFDQEEMPVEPAPPAPPAPTKSTRR